MRYFFYQLDLFQSYREHVYYSDTRSVVYFVLFRLCSQQLCSWHHGSHLFVFGCTIFQYKNWFGLLMICLCIRCISWLACHCKFIENVHIVFFMLRYFGIFLGYGPWKRHAILCMYKLDYKLKHFCMFSSFVITLQHFQSTTIRYDTMCILYCMMRTDSRVQCNINAGVKWSRIR